MPGFVSFDIKDYDGESGNHRFETTMLTAANWAAQATLRGDYAIALNNIILGVRARYRYGNRTIVSTSAASAPVAQRELKMLVQYHDTVTGDAIKPVELPCPNLNNLDPGDHTHFYIGDADVIDALITAFEAYVVSPAGNAVEVDELSLVGRRL
jgi:hypothetical protein